MTLYLKVLNEDGSAHHGGTGQWHKPSGKRPGKWMPAIPNPVPCQQGYHLCRDATPQAPAVGYWAMQRALELEPGHDCTHDPFYLVVWLLVVGTDGVRTVQEVPHPIRPHCVMTELSDDATVEQVSVCGVELRREIVEALRAEGVLTPPAEGSAVCPICGAHVTADYPCQRCGYNGPRRESPPVEGLDT